MRVAYVFRSLNGKQRRGPVPIFLESLGFETAVAVDQAIPRGWADVVWIQGSINWYPKARESLLAMCEADRPRVIYWHTEPLPLPSSAGLRQPLPTMPELAKILLRDPRATDARTNARRIRQMSRGGLFDVLVVSTQARKLYLAEQGIDAHFVPVGRYPSQGGDMGLERDIAALFVGILTDSRYRRSIRYLQRNGIEVTAFGDWNRSKGLWGEDRTRTINRARTFLALQRHPFELSGIRMILGMANRALVISEPVLHPEPYIPGTHYVSVPLEDMPDAIRHYNEHPDEGRTIADAGHRLVTTELTFENSMTKILGIAGLA